jgi:undecaprenyl-phosphate 4-deoxy-4-formamido-L-arabinose transferase
MKAEGSVSFVVPVFRSRESLAELCERIGATMGQQGRDYEIVLVEDCGGDGSWDAIMGLAAANPRVRGFRLARNFGQHNALLCGIREARGETIVTLDDDLQHPPEEIPKLLAHLGKGHDVVYGVPEHERHGLWRAAASQITKIVLRRAMGAETARNISAFRAFPTRLREGFAAFEGPIVSIDVLLTYGASRFGMLRVRHAPRAYGRSNYTLAKLTRHAMNMVTGFSTLPLRLASWIGFGLTLFGAVLLLYVVIRFLIQGGVVPGFSFLASAIAIFSGAQLFALGIMGEYLARMFERSAGRPSYLVGEKTKESGDGP